MNVDLSTLSLIIAVVMLMHLVSLRLQMKVNNIYKGLNYWFWGNVLLTLGSSLFFLRNIEIIKFFAIVFSNTIIVCGMVLIYKGINKFLNITKNYTFLWIVSFAGFWLFYYFTIVNDLVKGRMIVYSAIISFISFLTAFSILKNKTKHINTSSVFLAIVYLVYGAFYFIRGIYIIYLGKVNIKIDIIDSNIILWVSLVCGYFFIIGLILLVNQRLNSKQKKMIEELELLNATKNRLFSIIGHDLRGPIGNMVEILKLINDGIVDEEKQKKEIIPELLKVSGFTLNLLENLLIWAKNQREDISINKELFDINEIIIKSIEINKINADKKKISLQNDLEEKVLINADKEMITTVLRNLISNAIKFTKENGLVKTEVIKEESFIKVVVVDNGIGIKKDNLDKLFKMDTNITTFGTTGEKGTGIGLILCKELIEKNNGKIWVESEENIGSKFIFTIPL